MLASPAPAGAATGMEVALQDDAVLVSDAYYGREKALDRARELRVSTIRVNVLWSSVVGSSATRRSRPSPVRYDFGSYDQLVNAALARGLRVQMALTGSAPAWATGNRRRGVYKPKYRYFEDFAEATAQHFRGLVTRYSIWNEPNHVGWLAPIKSQPGLYAQLYKAGYRAIKRVDPSAEVLIGETAPFATSSRVATPPLAFLRGVLRVNRSWKGSRKYALEADGFAHHPYDFRHSPTYRYPGSDNVTLATLSRLTQALDRLARYQMLRTPKGRRLDVWLTEYGYMGSGRYRVSDARRGSYLKYAFDRARRNSRVRQMLQFLLVQPGSEYRFFDTSLLPRRGGETRAFRSLRSWAASAASKGKIARPPGT
ncbi:MAG TPA: cellulase family glycosylhydrolase [Thermoleophilaceae bacterium]